MALTLGQDNYEEFEEAVVFEPVPYPFCNRWFAKVVEEELDEFEVVRTEKQSTAQPVPEPAGPKFGWFVSNFEKMKLLHVEDLHQLQLQLQYMFLPGGAERKTPEQQKKRIVLHWQESEIWFFCPDKTFFCWTIWFLWNSIYTAPKM